MDEHFCRFEIYCRDLSKRYSEVRVISGPLWLPEKKNGKKMVTYEVIGDQNVAVPTHLFKVILVESTGLRKYIAAFIVPNVPIANKPLKDFQVSLEELEKCAGFCFHAKLNRSTFMNLCKVDGCALTPADQLELWYIHKNIESATSLHRLETVWSDLEKKNLKPDKQLTSLYNKKKMQLSPEKQRRHAEQ